MRLITVAVPLPCMETNENLRHRAEWHTYRLTCADMCLFSSACVGVSKDGDHRMHVLTCADVCLCSGACAHAQLVRRLPPKQHPRPDLQRPGNAPVRRRWRPLVPRRQLPHVRSCFQSSLATWGQPLPSGLPKAALARTKVARQSSSVVLVAAPHSVTELPHLSTIPVIPIAGMI